MGTGIRKGQVWGPSDSASVRSEPARLFSYPTRSQKEKSPPERQLEFTASEDREPGAASFTFSLYSVFEICAEVR